MQLRKPEYISPSALRKFEENPEEYFMAYLSPVRVPRLPQTMPMAAGSAFDAHVKSFLHDVIYGKTHKDAAKYELRTLFEAQVESHNRDWAWVHGGYLFKMYTESGALADLLSELAKSADDPRFEFDLKGAVGGYREGITKHTCDAILMGKPDLRWMTEGGIHVIFDWKVNGYCGKYNTSPKPGYIQCRSWDGCWTRGGQHKDVLPMTHKGIQINAGAFFESHEPDWAMQLATYGWLLGDNVGADMVGCVDQVACNGSRTYPYSHPRATIENFPVVRFASHKARISDRFQFEVLNRYQKLWSILEKINTDQFYFFQDVSFEESRLKVETLTKQCAMLADPELPDEIKATLAWSRGLQYEA